MGGAVQEAQQVNGETHGLAVALSFPIIYWNANLVRKAGGDPDRLPTDWDGIIALAKRMGALGGDVSKFVSPRVALRLKRRFVEVGRRAANAD